MQRTPVGRSQICRSFPTSESTSNGRIVSGRERLHHALPQQPIEARVELGATPEEGEHPVGVAIEVHLQDIKEHSRSEEERLELAERVLSQ